MASTIQLKTGTSGTPSNLTNGEVAINVNDGLFYYGSGSGNVTQQLESFTHVTASGDISASGDIHANEYKIGGYNGLTFNSTSLFLGNADNWDIIQYGRETTDTHTFIGNVTSSGNITASGFIGAEQFKVNGLPLASTTATNNILIGNDNSNPIVIGRAGVTPILLNGPVTASIISASGTISASKFHGDGSDLSNISSTPPAGTISSSQHIFTALTASGNISASGTIITEDLQVDTITNHTAGGGIILDAAGFIGLDSAGGDIRFRDAGANQLHFDMDGTDGAQVISPSVAGDDIIFKNQGGDSVLTLKSEGQTEIHGNITASGNISASGNVYSNNIEILAQGSARVSSITNTTDYWGPNFQGPYHTANWNRNVTPEANGNVILERQKANSGFIVPYSCSLVGFDAIGSMNTGENTHFSMSLFTADALTGMNLNISDAAAGLFTASHATTGISQGNRGTNRHRMTGSCAVSLSPFSVVFPLVKIDAAGNDDGAMSLDMTYVLKIKRIK